MNAWRVMLVQPALERSLKTERVITVVLAVCAMLTCLATWFWTFPVRAAAGLGVVLAGIGIFMWWAIFLRSAILQNAPTHACLVPGLRRRLMTLTASLWILASLAPAALFGGMLGHAGYLLVGAAVILLFVAASLRFRWIIFPFIVLTQVFKEPLASALHWAARPGELIFTLAGFGVLLPLAAWVLWKLFPRGGDRHHAWRDRAGRRDRELRSGVMTADQQIGLIELLRRPLGGLYLKSLSGRGRKSQATHLLDGLGPRLHWSEPLAGFLFALLFTVFWFGVTDARFLRMAGAFILLVAALPVMTTVKTMTAVLKGTASEQALLRLAPAAPASAALNRELALALLQRYGAVWAGYLVHSAILAVMLVGPELRWLLWGYGAALTAAFAPQLLRDYARAPDWPASNIVIGAALIVLPILSFVVPHISPGLAYGGVLAILVAAVTMLVTRWRTMVEAPLALPAGYGATDAGKVSAG